MQPVPVLMGAQGWGPAACVLVLETLKRLLAPANRNRDFIVHQALQQGLVQELLQQLDWRKQGDAAGAPCSGRFGSGGGSSQQVGESPPQRTSTSGASGASGAVAITTGGGGGMGSGDSAVLRALAVDVLMALSQEGMHKEQVCTRQLLYIVLVCFALPHPFITVQPPPTTTRQNTPPLHYLHPAWGEKMHGGKKING